jgi:hypothetical protein
MKSPCRDEPFSRWKRGVPGSVALLTTVFLYSIVCIIPWMEHMMSERRSVSIDYNEVPTDFPYQEDGSAIFERWVDWGVCEELARHLCRECLSAKAGSHRSERPVDILLQVYRRAESLGWGEPEELAWVFRRVAALLNWPTPDVVQQP